MAEILRQRWLDSTRARILALLQTGRLTSDDIASSLGLTRSAVRVQLTAMERDDIVRQAGVRPGTTRPSRVFELTPSAELLLSKAYVPVLVQLVDVVTKSLPPHQVEAVLRQTGKRVARALSKGRRAAGTLKSRAAAASEMLNAELRAATRVESNGKIVIRGAGCPLAALTASHRGVCLAMESLVGELVGSPVRECCDRNGRPRCCFTVVDRSRKTRTAR